MDQGVRRAIVCIDSGQGRQGMYRHSVALSLVLYKSSKNLQKKIKNYKPN